MAGTALDMVFYYVVNHVVLWCVGIPMAVMFAAYLIAVVVMCTKELWRTREAPRKGVPKHEETDPHL